MPTTYGVAPAPKTPADRAIRILACAAIVLGVFFRAYALDRPLYWQDEVATEVRVTGHTTADYGKIFDGKIRAVREIRVFGEVDPSKTAFDVMATLAHEDPQHVPIYYMLERLAIGVLGTSVVAMRALSVLCGIVAIGLAFVFGRQLAGARVGAIAASLVAVSPLFILMSRQAREYALFCDTTLLASIALVAALRAPGARRWLAYAASVVLGIYSDSLFPLVVVGHGIAALAVGKRDGRAFLAWLASATVACATFVPWIVASAGARSRVASSEDWVKSTYSLTVLAEKLAFDFGALAFDGEYLTLRVAVFAIFAIVVGAVAVATGLRASRSFARWLPLAIAFPTLFVLGAIDLVAHAHFVTVPRYLVGTWVGLELAIAVGLGYALERPRLRRLALSGWTALLVLGIAAAAMRGQAENWWDDADGIAYQALARVIAKTPHPLVVTENRWNTPLELSRYLPSDARILAFDFDRGVPALPRTQNAFVVAPPAGELARLVSGEHARLANVSPAPRPNLQSLSPSRHDDTTDDPTRPDNALWFVSAVARR